MRDLYNIGNISGLDNSSEGELWRNQTNTDSNKDDSYNDSVDNFIPKISIHSI
jgi:hypothetical protein